MRSILKFTLLIICSYSFSQTNLLDTSTWTAGTGSVVGFNIYGTDLENTRILGQDPFGSQSVLWKSIPIESNNGNRGWFTDYINIDHSKTYRFAVWVKKTNSTDGTIYISNRGIDDSGSVATQDLDGVLNGAGYFFSSDPPNLNEWYLIVCYMHDSNYSSALSIGGVYDTNGIRITNTKEDAKFSGTAVELNLGVYLKFSDNVNDELLIYAPTLYEVNGQEPTLQELIDGPSSVDTQAPTAPILTSTVQTDATADLSWTAASDDTAVTGYNVYKDGVLEATLGNVLTYQATGLTASTSYNFTVTATDAAGNESIASNLITVTTETSSGGGGSTGNVNWSLNNQDVFYNIGNVGIGTDTPDTELEVIGSIKAGLDHTRDNGLAKVSISSKWGNWMSFVDDYSNDTYGFHNPNNGGRMEIYIHDAETDTYNFGVFTILNNGNIGLSLIHI